MKASDLIPGMQYYHDLRIRSVVYIGYDATDTSPITFARFNIDGFNPMTYITHRSGKVGEMKPLGFEPLSRYLFMRIEAHMKYGI